MKKCFKCGEQKELGEFYRHPRMSDGHLGKCKECAKRDVSENYRARKEIYQAYERERRARPARRESVRRYHKEHVGKYPHKAKARIAVSNALRDRRITKPDACQRCGKKGAVQGHHPDHRRYLDVEWLCIDCHRAADLAIAS